MPAARRGGDFAVAGEQILGHRLRIRHPCNWRVNEADNLCGMPAVSTAFVLVESLKEMNCRDDGVSQHADPCHLYQGKRHKRHSARAS
jgi:hypothetical protein